MYNENPIFIYHYLFNIWHMVSLILKTANTLPMYDTFHSTQKLPLLKEQKESLEMVNNDVEKNKQYSYNLDIRSKTRCLGLNQKITDEASLIEFRLIE